MLVHAANGPADGTAYAVGVAVPSVDGVADHDAGVVAGHVVELRGVFGVGDDELGAAAGDAVGQVGRAQRTGGRHDDRAELGDGEHRLPQLDLVAQHQDDPVTLADAEPAEPRRNPVGALGHLREADLVLVAVLLDDPQRGALRCRGR